MLEADSGGLFKDQNLWRVAALFFKKAKTRGESMPLLFAVRDDETLLVFTLGHDSRN